MGSLGQRAGLPSQVLRVQLLLQLDLEPESHSFIWELGEVWIILGTGKPENICCLQVARHPGFRTTERIMTGVHVTCPRVQINCPPCVFKVTLDLHGFNNAFRFQIPEFRLHSKKDGSIKKNKGPYYYVPSSWNETKNHFKEILTDKKILNILQVCTWNNKIN